VGGLSSAIVLVHEFDGKSEEASQQLLTQLLLHYSIFISILSNCETLGSVFHMAIISLCSFQCGVLVPPEVWESHLLLSVAPGDRPHYCSPHSLQTAR
jgi:hypothetical protein